MSCSLQGRESTLLCSLLHLAPEGWCFNRVWAAGPLGASTWSSGLSRALNQSLTPPPPPPPLLQSCGSFDPIGSIHWWNLRTKRWESFCINNDNNNNNKKEFTWLNIFILTLIHGPLLNFFAHFNFAGSNVFLSFVRLGFFSLKPHCV